MSLKAALDHDRRLGELDRYDVLDTPAEEAFDRITRLVCRLFGIEMSTVTFVDAHRQWFKSSQGVGIDGSARDISFCQIPVAENQALVVPNALEDTRFRDNPFVCGEPGIRFYAGVPICSAKGAAIGTLCAMDRVPRAFSAAELDLLSDLGRLVETELELRVQASTDALTGALSRRAFFAETDRAIALATRHRYDMSCVAFDIDHFKAVNDTKGHAAGDFVLRQAVRVCRDVLRKSDVLGRLGGEEFAILLPHTSPADGLAVAEKLREAIASRPDKRSGVATTITASFGVATLEPPRMDADELLDRADQAMYLAKSRGRNRSVVWEGPKTERTGLSRRVLKAGKIVFNCGNSAIDCTVKRLSEMGARLDVVSMADVPQRFKLSIPSDAFSRICAVADRHTRQIDVVFE